jgi:drug/metabolite transporter (DMT)-like permease
MLPAFLTTILFGLSIIAANRTTRALGGIHANFYRITLATFLLALWAYSFGMGTRGPAFAIFLLSGFVGFGLGDIALYQALPRIGSRLSILLVHCLAAPFAALVEWAWLGTVVTLPQLLSSLAILVGVGLALAPGEHIAIPRRLLVVGVLFGVAAACGQGLGAVLSRKAYQVTDLAGFQIDGVTAAYQRILAGWVVAAAFLLLSQRRASAGTSSVSRSPKPVLGWISLNALAGPTLGVSCYQWALATQPTAIVLPIVATTPLVVILLARFMENERPTPRSLAGGFLAVLGAAGLALLR